MRWEHIATTVLGSDAASVSFATAGLEYYRQRKRSMESFTTVRASGLKKASQEGAAVPAKVVVYGG